MLINGTSTISWTNPACEQKKLNEGYIYHMETDNGF
jgi:hypothetical protein